MKLYIVQPSLGAASETFLRAHNNLLSFDTTVVHFDGETPCINHKPIFSKSFIGRVQRKAMLKLLQQDWRWENTQALKNIFKRNADIVMAEYGPMGVRCVDAARLADVPLVTHFHGYDVSKYETIKKYKDGYQKIFQYSSAIIAVSKKMVGDLVSLGAPIDKIHLNPCGVDTNTFQGAEPNKSEPILAAVGRFVEKKAPYLTIMAFAKVLKKIPEAKLIMLGGGPLEGVCKDIALTLGLESSIIFKGESSHTDVKKTLAEARAFVQHSIQASDGDCEGTPVGVMEAQAIGLPVVATAHAGISDVVVHEKTGFLVEEKDIDSMATFMTRVLEDPDLAYRLGKQGRERIKQKFSMQISINELEKILKSCVSGVTS